MNRFHNPQNSRFSLCIFKDICLERNTFKLSCSFSLSRPLYDAESHPEWTNPLKNIALLSFHLISLPVLSLHYFCMNICWHPVRMYVNTSQVLVKITQRW